MSAVTQLKPDQPGPLDRLGSPPMLWKNRVKIRNWSSHSQLGVSSLRCSRGNFSGSSSGCIGPRDLITSSDHQSRTRTLSLRGPSPKPGSRIRKSIHLEPSKVKTYGGWLVSSVGWGVVLLAPRLPVQSPRGPLCHHREIISKKKS